MRDWGEAVKEAAKIQNHNEKKDGQRGSERGGQRDADQLITAANKMQIYPGTVSMPKFKHSAIQKNPELRWRCASDDFQTKADYPIIINYYYYY